MQKNSVLKTTSKIIMVKAKGKNKEAIFQDGFEKMRKAVYANFNNLIVSLKTLEVKIDASYNDDVHASKLNKEVEIEFDIEISYIDL